MNRYKRLYLGKDELGNKVYKNEHRYVMEQYLKRKLTSDEVVHHIDGNKQNNNIHNLKLMTKSEHTSLHTRGQYISDKQKDLIRQKLIHRPNLFSRKKNI